MKKEWPKSQHRYLRLIRFAIPVTCLKSYAIIVILFCVKYAKTVLHKC